MRAGHPKSDNLITPHQTSIFRALIVYRWVSLLPALFLWVLDGAAPEYPDLMLFGLLLGANYLLTVFHEQINKLVQQQPWLIGFDIFIAVFVLFSSGGAESPYFLFSLNPLMASALFFQIPGGLVSAMVFSGLYGPGMLLFGNMPFSGMTVHILSQVAGIWLLPLLVGYLSRLFAELQKTSLALSGAHQDLGEQNLALASANQKLNIIHNITLLLQAAPDLQTVQKSVVEVVQQELEFREVVLGLIDPNLGTLGNWYFSGDVATTKEGMPKPLPVGPAANLTQQLSTGLQVYSAKEMSSWLEFLPSSGSRWYGLSLNMRDHAVGIMLAGLPDGLPEISEKKRELLQIVANQSAVALGTTLVCIDRTRRLSVEQERNRIARDIHDTVAQSLFGIVYTLDASIKMLPGQADVVRDELVDLRDLASVVRDEVRRSIYDLWPGEITPERFREDLSQYVAQCCRPKRFQADIHISGPFDLLEPNLRRTLYLVSQEALVNAARHSGCDSAQLCLAVEDERVYLLIRDDGRGFDPAAVLPSSTGDSHFGLQGMLSRMKTFGGNAEVLSREQSGTMILFETPRSA